MNWLRLDRKAFSYATAQTNTVIWTPSSGMRVSVAGYIINVSGLLDVSIQIFFDTNSGNNLIFTGNMDVSLNAPVNVFFPLSQATAGLVDQELKITTNANSTVSGIIFGFED